MIPYCWSSLPQCCRFVSDHVQIGYSGHHPRVQHMRIRLRAVPPNIQVNRKYTCTNTHQPKYTCTSNHQPKYICTSNHQPKYTYTSNHQPEYACTSNHQPKYTCTSYYQPKYICTKPITNPLLSVQIHLICHT